MVEDHHDPASKLWFPEFSSSPRYPPRRTPQGETWIWCMVPSRRRPWHGPVTFISATGPPVGSSPTSARPSSPAPPTNTSTSTPPPASGNSGLVNPLLLEKIPILPIHHIGNLMRVCNLDTVDLCPHRDSFVVGYQYSLFRIVGGPRLLSRRVEFVKDTVEDRLYPLRGSDDHSRRGEGTRATNTVPAMTITISIRVAIVVAIRVAVIPWGRRRRHSRHYGIGILELCTLVPFRKHLGRRLHANTPDGFAAGARLAAVEVAD